MRPSLGLPALALFVASVLTACGDEGEDRPDTGGTAAAAADFPVTIEHVYGDTVIPAKPERIATVAWANHEVPLALGVVPVGMSRAAWGDDDGDGVLPWVEDRLEELDAETPVLFDEADGIDFEAVAETAPDIILAAYSGLTQEDYDTLSAIAPVVAYPEVAWGTSWQDMVLLNSRAIGLADEGEELVAGLEDDVAEAFAEHPDLQGSSVLVSWLDTSDLSQIGFYTSHDTRPGFLEEFGMTAPGVVAEATAGTDEFYTTISAEEGDRLVDVDLLVTYGDPDGSTLRALQKDPVIGRVPVVESGAVAVLPDATPLAASANPSPLSIPSTLDDYLDLLDHALQERSLSIAPPRSTTPAQAGVVERRRVRWLLAALAVVVCAALASVVWGTRSVGWHDVVGGVTGSPDSLAQAAVAKRVPRTLLALLVGAALGIAGAAMQGLTRNPLADPGLLGVTSGASLAVVVGIAFFSLGSPSGYVWVAIGGATAAALLVYALGTIGRGRSSPLRLVLSGAVCSAAFSSLTAAVLLPRVQVMNEFRFWQVGGVGGATYPRLLTVLPFLAVGAMLALAAARGLNALALGDEVAAGLGEQVARVRATAALSAVVLCGAATAIAGPIGFVGLVVPHAARLVVGHDQRWVLPMSALVGAALLTVSDVLGRVVARPAEVDVGIVTALVGGPVFVLLVRRLKVRAL